MRRADLTTAENIKPGLYVVDGDEGDPAGLIVGGPYPDTDVGRAIVGTLAGQLARRTGRPASWVVVVDLPS